jgi:hypothetical protein
MMEQGDYLAILLLVVKVTATSEVDADAKLRAAVPPKITDDIEVIDVDVEELEPYSDDGLGDMGGV